MVKVDFDLSGVKIPKRVAGVKVPKELRKKGKRLLEKANSDAGREAIAAGLTIAATAIAAKAKAKAARASAHAFSEHGDDAHRAPPRTPEPPQPPEPPRPGGGRPGDPGIDPATDLGAAIANGIGALQRFLKDKHG